jgi:hypothetical protein
MRCETHSENCMNCNVDVGNSDLPKGFGYLSKDRKNCVGHEVGWG